MTDIIPDKIVGGVSVKDIYAYAQQGALFLDGQDKDWFKQIDLGQLNLGEPSDCVIGQLFKDWGADAFDMGLETLFTPAVYNTPFDRNNVVIQNGFDAPEEVHEGLDLMEYYQVLTEAWKFQVLSRSAR